MFSLRSLFIPLVVFASIGFGPGLTLAQDARQQAYLDAIKANPKDATAHFNLGLSYFNQQNYDEAVNEFKKCLQINSNDNDAKELLECSEGISAYLQKNYSMAVDHLQKTVKLNPKNQNANMLLGDSYLQLKQFDNAETALQNYAQAFPDDKKVQAKAHEGLGTILLGEKKYLEATKELAKAATSDPKNYSAIKNLGYAYYQLKNYKEAAVAFEKVAQFKKDMSTFELLGGTYYNLGDFSNSILNYKKAIQIESAKDPKEQDTDSLAEAYYNLGVAYSDNALFDEAVESYEKAFQINPKDSNAAAGKGIAIESAITSHMDKATHFLVSNRYGEAVGEWNKVLKYQPDNEQVKGFIADAQTKLQVEVDKHYAAGRVQAQAGKTLGALSEWNLALQMDPDNEKIKKAIRSLEVRKNDRVKALLAQGDQLNQDGDYSGALDAYTQAAKVDPRNKLVKARLKKISLKRTNEIDSVFTRAMSAYSKGDLKSAQKYMAQAKEIDPKSQKVGDALFKIQKDITLRIKALNGDGVALFNDGKKDEAKLKFEEVLKLKSSDETANEYVKKMTGQQSHEKADAEMVKALYYDGVNLYINGKIHEAIKKWQECLKQDPGNVNAQNNIDKAMAKLKSIEKLNGN